MRKILFTIFITASFYGNTQAVEGTRGAFRDSLTSLTNNTDLLLIGLGTGGVRIEKEYTLPKTDGTANQVFKTDGAGNIVFDNVSFSEIEGTDTVLTISDTVSTLATQYDLTQIQGYTVTNEANNRVITSTGSGTGNAETNLTFDGTNLNIVSGGLQVGGTEVISSGRAISGNTGAFSGDITKELDNGGQLKLSKSTFDPLIEFYRWSGVSTTYWGNRITRGGSNGFIIQGQSTAQDIGSHTWSDYLTIANSGAISTNGGSLTAGAITGTSGTFSDDIVLTNSSLTNTIRHNTADGTDNARTIIQAGSAISTARGGNIGVYGNEYTGQEGNVNLVAGLGLEANGSGQIGFFTQAIKRGFIDYDGSWSTNGNSLTAGATTVTSFTNSGVAGTGERIKTTTSTGVEGAISNGTDGQVMTMVSGSPAWADNAVDIEENDWTPTSANGGAFTSTGASYYKVGKQVTLWCQLSVDASAQSNTDPIQISGLPFTVKARASGIPNYVGTAMESQSDAVTNGLAPFINNATEYIQLRAEHGGTNYSYQDLFSNVIYFQITYITD